MSLLRSLDMNFRTANLSDKDTIAALHTLSWQTAYTNVLSDYFLENEVEQERMAHWEEKFKKIQVSDNYWILLAENENELLGFICVIGNEDPNYGSLIDNLHVHPKAKGQGIGKQLLTKGLAWVRENYPDKGIYLWVYKANHSAVAFYEKMEGLCAELLTTANPDGGKAEVWRIIWQREKRTVWDRLRLAFNS